MGFQLNFDYSLFYITSFITKIIKIMRQHPPTTKKTIPKNLS